MTAFPHLKITGTILAIAAILGGCAAYEFANVKPGDSENYLYASAGTPAMRWQDADGSSLLAYPRAGNGYQTLMVKLDSNHRVQWVRNVLDQDHFTQITPGMTQDEVLRRLGPPERAPVPSDTTWGWWYQTRDGSIAHFNVFFDPSTTTVTGTSKQIELAANQFDRY